MLTILMCLALGPALAPAASAGDCPEAMVHPSLQGAGSRAVDLPIDLPVERRLQAAFESGRQPWRGDATWVAAVAVMEALGAEPLVDPPSLLAGRLAVECEGPSESVVAGRGESNEYRIYLKRLVPRADERLGIWTAIRVVVTPGP